MNSRQKIFQVKEQVCFLSLCFSFQFSLLLLMENSPWDGQMTWVGFLHSLHLYLTRSLSISLYLSLSNTHPLHTKSDAYTQTHHLSPHTQSQTVTLLICLFSLGLLSLSQLPEMFSSIQSKSLFFFHFSLLSFFLQMEWTNCEMKPSFGKKRLILKERLILHLAIIWIS